MLKARIDNKLFKLEDSTYEGVKSQIELERNMGTKFKSKYTTNKKE
jgi:hypothetical protein